MRSGYIIYCPMCKKEHHISEGERILCKGCNTQVFIQLSGHHTAWVIKVEMHWAPKEAPIEE